MPHYDYECKKCGHTFEAFQQITDKPLNSCPKCKGGLKRLISSGAGLIFKGNGFYATDYKKAKVARDSSKETCKPNPSCSRCPNNTAGISKDRSKDKPKNI